MLMGLFLSHIALYVYGRRKYKIFFSYAVLFFF